MSNLRDRLLLIMKEMGMEKSKDLALFCDVSEGMVSQWLKDGEVIGPKPSLGAKPLLAFSRTNYNLDWINSGDGDKYRIDPQAYELLKLFEQADDEGKKYIIHAASREVLARTKNEYL